MNMFHTIFYFPWMYHHKAVPDMIWYSMSSSKQDRPVNKQKIQTLHVYEKHFNGSMTSKFWRIEIIIKFLPEKAEIHVLGISDHFETFASFKY